MTSIYDIYEILQTAQFDCPVKELVVLASDNIITAWDREIIESTNREYLPMPSYEPKQLPTSRDYHIGGIRVIPVKDKIADTIPELCSDRYWICDKQTAANILRVLARSMLRRRRGTDGCS